MSTYIVPKTLVYQEFNSAVQASTKTLCAHISGGHAYLLRYDNSDEKETGLLGYYDPASDTALAWPSRPTGATVDTSYTKVYIDDALLRYFSSVSGTDEIFTVAGKINTLDCDTLSFATDGASYPASTDFGDRGVRVGDTAEVTYTVSGDTYTLWTYISGFTADTVASTRGAATADATNQATQAAPTPTYSQTAGDINEIDISAASQTSYDGLATGDVNESYRVIVTQSSSDGDATTARLRVISASGNDDVASVTPVAFSSATPIGTRGLTVTWSSTSLHSDSLSAADEGVSPLDFIEGQTWEIASGQAFTAPTPTSGGTYTGTSDCTYIVTVTEGGLWASSPKIVVTTNKGTDVSGPTSVTSTGAVAIGTCGVTIAFSGTYLCAGDRFYIPVTAATSGAIHTLKLGHNMAAAVATAGPIQVSLNLYIRNDVEITENRTEAAPQVNWSQGETQLTLKSGITAYDASWTVDGVAEPLPVYSSATQGYGKVYVTYRAWRSDLCADVYSIDDVADIDTTIAGALHPDNPLKWGVYKALQNANGVYVRYTAVANPASTACWSTVLELIADRIDVYGLVPLTRNTTVLGEFVAHVTSQSSAESGRWRVLWISIDGASLEEYAKVNASTSTDEEVVLATITADPDTSSHPYTIVSVPAHNGQFLVNGVTAGDLVRCGYTTDGFDNVIYSEYIVDEVINEDTLRLVSGPAAAVSVAAQIEIWNTRIAGELAAAVAGNSYTTRRIRFVWPDTYTDGSYTAEGYFLCAALAGLASGVSPQQGLTNLEITGVDAVPRTTKLFSKSQLDTMAAGGTWIVTQNLYTGTIYSRHALTTGDYSDINEREEMVTRNNDSISYYFQDLLDPYIGVSNVTPSTIAEIETTINAGILELSSHTYIARLGPQLISGTINYVQAHATLSDRLVASVTLDQPYPLNNLEFHLIV